MPAQNLDSGKMSPQSWELVEYLHPSLVTLDYTNTRVKLTLVLSSFVLWAVIYIASVCVSSLTVTYNKLKVKEKVFWNLAVVRATFGFFCTAVGLWAIFTETALDHDVIFGTTPTSHFALAITVGFFIFECGALSISDVIFRTASIMLNVHHWLALMGYVLVMYIGAGHCFGCKGLILEMSTPFSALCWTLLKAGKEHTLLWKANQFWLVHTFHLRSVIECMFWYISYQHWSYIWAEMPTPLFVILYVQLVLVTLIMTPYWTYKKTYQLINPVDWNFEREKSEAPRQRNLQELDPECTKKTE